MNKPKIMEVSC